jgi:ATP-dependent DNA helicase RecQ
MDPHEVLRQYFGHRSFREGQETLISQLLTGRDVLGIMPTGAGKSICYQVPALVMDGITLVVSPLISLMKDQVGALIRSGVRAAYINSSLTSAQNAEALRRAARGLYKIIYVAPERLLTGAFLSFASAARIAMVTVDEAHCVSQWGQDFRPSYLNIPEFLEALPARPVVGAFTATATDEVKTDIVRLLRLRDPYSITTGFDRGNLYFEVRRPREKSRELVAYLQTHGSRSGVIYCLTRKTVEAVCETLTANGFPATRYHAGLDEAERRRNQDDFLYDRKPIMVATNAFGMGIDKSNVSFVVHYNMPKNIESYYQEAGRAGRDGEPADCVLFYSPQDVRTNQFLIDNGAEANDKLPSEAREDVRDKDRERLKQMTWYCTTTDCLRAYILRYFGERTRDFCGHCGNCHTHFETVDIHAQAVCILAAVERLALQGRRVGRILLAETLHGGRSERLLRLGLDRVPDYGLLASVSAADIRRAVELLIDTGLLAVTGDEYPVVVPVGPAASLAVPTPLLLKRPKGKREEKKAATAAAPEDPALFEALKAVRAELARTEKVPAFLIFSNATLRDMCRRLPTTPETFLQISGVGQAKAARYAAAFMAAIQIHLAGAASGGNAPGPVRP